MRYRIVVTSSDGQKCGINVPVSPTVLYETSVYQVADHLRIDRDRIERILGDKTFGPEEAKKHLEQFAAEVLDSPAIMRTYRDHPHKQP